MNRRGFLGSLVATAAGVLVPADVLASPGRVYFDMGRKRWLERGVLVAGAMRVLQPGIYALAARSRDGGSSLMFNLVVTPSMIESGGHEIDPPFSPGFEPKAGELLDVYLTRIGDSVPRETSCVYGEVQP